MEILDTETTTTTTTTTMTTRNGNIKNISILQMLKPSMETLIRVAKDGTGKDPIKDDDFVSSLPDFWSDWFQIIQSMSSNNKNNSNVVIAWWDELEFRIRNHLLTEIIPQVIKLSHGNDVALLEEGMEELVLFTKCTELVCMFLLHHPIMVNNSSSNKLSVMTTNSLKKIPFAVVEDALDALPLPLRHVYWKITQQQLLPEWCESELFQSSGTQLLLIRLCNKLLKKNSPKEDVLLLLASVFPLSERSAVNVLGRFHTNNVVTYDTSSKDELYRSFWSIQKYFTNPTLLLTNNHKSSSNNNSNSSNNSNVATEYANWKQRMESFITNMQTILSAWEGHAFSSQEYNNARSRWIAQQKKQAAAAAAVVVVNQPNNKLSSSKDCLEENIKEDGEERPEYLKYLTNPQLLPLQLQDAELRFHVMVQFLIIHNYVTTSLKAMLPKQLPLYKATMEDWLKHDLAQLHKRCADCMCATPPHGKEFYQTIQWLLMERECLWKEWKQNKCNTPIEKKNKQQTIHLSPTTKDKEDNTNLATQLSMPYSFSLSHSSLKTQSPPPPNNTTVDKQHSSTVIMPTIPSFMENYIEALDPEAGIEDEYHPRNDKLFCWRALRLISRSFIPHQIQKSNGDFERLVRNIWKQEEWGDILGEMPPPPEEEEEEFMNQETEEDNNTVASVHSEEVSVVPQKDEKASATTTSDNKVSNQKEESKYDDAEEEEGEEEVQHNTKKDDKKEVVAVEKQVSSTTNNKKVTTSKRKDTSSTRKENDKKGSLPEKSSSSKQSDPHESYNNDVESLSNNHGKRKRKNYSYNEHQKNGDLEKQPKEQKQQQQRESSESPHHPSKQQQITNEDNRSRRNNPINNYGNNNRGRSPNHKPYDNSNDIRGHWNNRNMNNTIGNQNNGYNNNNNKNMHNSMGSGGNNNNLHGRRNLRYDNNRRGDHRENNNNNNMSGPTGGSTGGARRRPRRN